MLQPDHCLEGNRVWKVVLDVKLFTEFMDILILERKTVICDDRHGYTIPTDDVIKDE